MAERNYILIDLVKEVLGPRLGPHEVLLDTQNPRDEYITGVLAPARAPRQPDDIEADSDEVIEETTSEEDQDTQGLAIVPGVFSPALDPKALPRSIGLSFTVEADSDTQPQIEVCATWARYRQQQQGWQRYPSVCLTGPVGVENNEWSADIGVSLQLRSRMISNGRWRISLFLVNTTQVDEAQPTGTGDYIFQPQIRTHCCTGTKLIPVHTVEDSSLTDNLTGSLAVEDASLSLLYRERTALARGHLCGVTWKAIDPERPHTTLPSPAEAPFAWTDGILVAETEQEKFSPADVRTEMVPCYPIEAPSMNWREEYGSNPVLDPEVLAETWQSIQMQERLLPLVEGYEAWLAGQRTQIVGLSATQQSMAETHLQYCHEAAQRMREAVEILANDGDVRLAFCFANKAIAVQSRWNNTLRGRTDEVLNWRPFQLAFILLNIAALANPLHSDRRTCDLLWFPTGGGKTEAYLGLAAFTLALRRRRSRQNAAGDQTGAGVGVFSRYTLRLLTIQQFRRALGVITACEMLRVYNLDQSGQPVGWRPKEYTSQEHFLWGGIRFSAGLWVGGGVTPNNQISIGPVPGSRGMVFYVGALDILQGAGKDYQGPNSALRKAIKQSSHLEKDGEPAQVVSCPCCGSTLAVPDDGLGPGQHTLHFAFHNGRTTTPLPTQLQSGSYSLSVDTVNIVSHTAANYRTLSLTFTIPDDSRLSANQIDEWWHQQIGPVLGQDVSLVAARPARPGYFILTYVDNRNKSHQCDFDIYCPNPKCELNQYAWVEQVPLSRLTRSTSASSGAQMQLMPINTGGISDLPKSPGLEWQEVPEYFRAGVDQPVSNRIPIPAFTVDDQIYHRCPSLVIATVDKFARLAFEPKAASLFGYVDHYHSRWGYYRAGSPPSGSSSLPTNHQPHPTGFARGHQLHKQVVPFLTPDLILQDELHLIEGPLGSMVGLYETAVDLLCQRQQQNQTIIPKYVASTATIRQAESQVQSLFDRKLAQFPPSALSADDRFFAYDQEVHPLESERPGRLYVAVCAPGKGVQTPIVRIWSRLLQIIHERLQTNSSLSELDRFYTLVGYFNAIRELAGALSLYRQDIPERMEFQSGANVRRLERPLELSSRASSLDLPMLLERLKVSAPRAQDAVLATSMFGTGVDVDRLGLMVVHGQPKTTAAYIQATGRVGRQGGGLVVTFFRASRPRDLDHYEFFTGYHRALYRYVEPITVAPFSPRARERGLGPLSVILLRQGQLLSGQSVHADWKVQQRLSGAYYALAYRMNANRYDPEVVILPELLEARASQQSDGRRPVAGATEQEAASELDRWAALAGQFPDTNQFVYSEPAMTRSPERHVVLGDVQHQSQGLNEVFENAPQSLREVEETTGFRI